MRLNFPFDKDSEEGGKKLLELELTMRGPPTLSLSPAGGLYIQRQFTHALSIPLARCRTLGQMLSLALFSIPNV